MEGAAVPVIFLHFFFRGNKRLDLKRSRIKAKFYLHKTISLIWGSYRAVIQVNCEYTGIFFPNAVIEALWFQMELAEQKLLKIMNEQIKNSQGLSVFAAQAR